MTDAYALSAEFYELLGREQREPVLRVLHDVLADADPAAGPVLELGAGTGLGTLVIAEALPSAEIVALEPSAAMRTVLYTRLAERPDLVRRVTVLPCGFPDAEPELPDRFSAVIGLAMLGHLDPRARQLLWRLLRTRLGPAGVAVFELQPPERPEVVPQTTYTRARLGDLEYEAGFAAEPSGPLQMDWTMRWRVHRGDRLLLEHVAQHVGWWTISVDDVREDAQAEGLRTSTVGEGLITLRPAT